MDNFTNMLSNGMMARGHKVQIWHPSPVLSKLVAGPFVRKWLRYLDQYFIFPMEIRRRVRKCVGETLFVFTDQALGPWVPLVSHRKHVIHCHDFLALHSATGLTPYNSTRFSGRVYQQYIKQGFLQGRNFIAVSKNTWEQLKWIHPELTISNNVVYNGLNELFCQTDTAAAREAIATETGIDTSKGYILHIGGNQWYKNRRGVIEIYNAWRQMSAETLPMIFVGEVPSATLLRQAARSLYSQDIHFISDKNDQFIQHAYNGAMMLLFPSLAEGFGWPIAEAMACGCPVVTTNQAPMTEVGSDAALYIDVRPLKAEEVPFWAEAAARVMESVCTASLEHLQWIKSRGIEYSKRFNLQNTLDQIEGIYAEVEQL